MIRVLDRALTVVLAFLLTNAFDSAELFAAEAEDFEQVVRFHLEEYPDLEVQDLYKLTFQAAMGSEHAVSDREGARQWLERELSTLSVRSGEQMAEPLSADGILIRINLRPFMESGGDLGNVVDAFVDTANQYPGSHERLRDYWSQVVTLATEGAIPFDPVEVGRYLEEMESQGFPPVRHSVTYRERYAPAYRVVLRTLVDPEPVVPPDIVHRDEE